ncbi:putative triacylglycerol lipase [Helianthus anomalus]
MLLKVLLLCVYSSFYLTSSKGRTFILQKDVSVSAVFVFGDSFVDQGNNNYINTLGKGNFLPYGKDFQGGKPTGRFSNGKTLPDLLGTFL